MSLTVVYYSTKSENTHRFVEKLDLPTHRLPLKPGNPPVIDFPYVLIFPSYGGGYKEGAIPGPVKEFLNIPENRALLRGVVATGNTNFGWAFCIGGHMVANKCKVPLLKEIEIMGMPGDAEFVKKAILSLEKEE